MKWNQLKLSEIKERSNHTTHCELLKSWRREQSRTDFSPSERGRNKAGKKCKAERRTHARLWSVNEGEHKPSGTRPIKMIKINLTAFLCRQLPGWNMNWRFSGILSSLSRHHSTKGMAVSMAWAVTNNAPKFPENTLVYPDSEANVISIRTMPSSH